MNHKEYVSCKLCGEDRSETLMQLQDLFFEGEEKFILVKCEKCGLLYINPRPLLEEMSKYYPDSYSVYKAPEPFYLNEPAEGLRKKLKDAVFNEGSFLGAVIRNTVVRFGANWRWYYSANPNQAGKKILDVGCASGQNLMMFKAYGWECYGVDYSEHAVNMAFQAGLEVSQGVLEDQHYPGEHFDMVWMSHVLEHVSDPFQTLKEMKRILKPGGKVYLEIPVVDALLPWLFKENYYGWEAPRHLYHFTKKTLSDLCQKAGFKMQVKSRTSSSAIFETSLGYILEKKNPSRKAAIRQTMIYGSTSKYGWLAKMAANMTRLLGLGEILSVELRVNS